MQLPGQWARVLFSQLPPSLLSYPGVWAILYSQEEETIVGQVSDWLQHSANTDLLYKLLH